MLGYNYHKETLEYLTILMDMINHVDALGCSKLCLPRKDFHFVGMALWNYLSYPPPSLPYQVFAPSGNVISIELY